MPIIGFRARIRTRKRVRSGQRHICLKVATTKATKQVKPDDSGQVKTHTGQQKDTFSAPACCTGVAQIIPQNLPLDLLRLAMLWDRIPIEIRQGWIITAETIF
jgi:hypothetical protein